MIALTFDVDFSDWIGGGTRDELTEAFPAIQQMLEDLPEVRTTWFVRLDRGMARRFGQADFAFSAYAGAIEWLRARGHEVAWHHHACNTDVDTPVQAEHALMDELARYEELARLHGCTSVRAGWGQHTSRSLAFLSDAGWNADSSAMPRVAYSWDPPLRNWSNAPVIPYFPSRVAHAREGTGLGALRIVEVPISMVPLPAQGDTIPDVKRYLNPAYHPAVFQRAASLVPTHTPLVAVCHPYELLGGREHPLYAFSTCALRHNIATLQQRCAPFVTISELANASRLPWCHADAA